MAKAPAAPSGLDTFTADEQSAIDAMRNEAEAAPAPAAPAETAASDPAPSIEIDIPAGAPAEDPEIELDDTAPGTKTDTVSKQALREERDRRKQAEKALAEKEVDFAAKQARAQERLDMLAAAIAASAPAPTPSAPEAEIEVPDLNADPVGHFRALAERQAKSVADLKAIITGMQEGQQQQQQQQAFAELRNWTASSERAFAATEPAYPDAMKWLSESRHAELEKIGIIDPAERAKIIGNDMVAIATRARKDGGDFAARLFGAAQARGYKKAPPAPDPALTATGAIPALDAPVVLPDAAARIEAGRQNSTTLGSAGAAPAAGRMSVDRLVSMSDAEFAKITGKMSPDQIRQLMGA